MRTVLPRYYVSVLTYDDGWAEEYGEPFFAVRDRETKTCSGQDLGIFAGLGIKQAMLTAAHHNRHIREGA